MEKSDKVLDAFKEDDEDFSGNVTFNFYIILKSYFIKYFILFLWFLVFIILFFIIL